MPCATSSSHHHHHFNTTTNHHLSVGPTTSPLHDHPVGPNQCSSTVVHTVSAPLPTVWSLLRRFDKPQTYKHFVKSCHVIARGGGGGISVGDLREVRLISGIPAVTSTERLEILDDESHVISFRIVGGEHRLHNYRSVTTLHPSDDDASTVVVESYVVDVPEGNTPEDTCHFVDTIVRCNLQSLAQAAEKMVDAAAAAANAGNSEG